MRAWAFWEFELSMRLDLDASEFLRVQSAHGNSLARRAIANEENKDQRVAALAVRKLFGFRTARIHLHPTR